MARDVAGCAAMLAALAPGLMPAEVELADLEVGVAWLELADAKVRASVETVAACFPRRRLLDLPLAYDIGPAFRREVADVHRELFLEHADSYGATVRPKIERCLAVTNAEFERAVERRERYRERFAEAVSGVDLVLTPTLVCVAPPAPADELALRGKLTRLTFPLNALGWPAAALPCGAAEEGLPASVQLAAPAAQDALVLGAAAALEHELSAH
jgi:aspartyl-tRNA(Asn)/glutamyl-tRNA(Gln) amidotransferase subunit A